MCRSEYLNYLRVREWQDIYAQLRRSPSRSASRSTAVSPPTRRACTSRCWPGCSSHRHEGPGQPARVPRRPRRQVRDLPRLGLFKKPPQFVMSAELVETSRLWARVNAKIEPEWVETLAQHLVKRTYSEPHWEEGRRGDGVREGHAVRRADRGPAQGQLRPDRPGGLAASCSSATRWSRATGDTHHKFFHDNRKLLERGRGAGGPGPAPRHPGRRRDAVRLLRRADRRRGRLRRALRHLVEEGRPAGPGPARLRAVAAGPRGRRGEGGRLPAPGRRTG